MDLCFVVNPHKQGALQVLERVRRTMPRDKHRLLLWDGAVEALRARVDYSDQLRGFDAVRDVHEADIVVTLGGDGTMLAAVRLLQDDLRPLFGINAGSLGFLTDTPAENVEQAMQALIEGRYRLEPRMLLEAIYTPTSAAPVRMLGLNDVVLNHGPLARVLEVSFRSAGVDLGSTLADGVIVATPSGSTAYNLSAGGPIVSPRLNALIMTPISAHTLSIRPLVVAADEGIEVWLRRASGVRAELTVDGHRGSEMCAGEHVVVGRARRDLELVVTRDTTFYDTLRTKLAWGQRGPAAGGT